jgi:anti-sigma28 factor (negative regulator of flagellin synthesis)
MNDKLSIEQRLMVLRAAIQSPRFEMDTDKIARLIDEAVATIRELRGDRPILPTDNK